MLRLLDNIYVRLKNAWIALGNPQAFNDEYKEGIEMGRAMGIASIMRTLTIHEPNDFENQHFKLGYYYAFESAKQVIANDEDHLVA